MGLSDVSCSYASSFIEDKNRDTRQYMVKREEPKLKTF